jgi:erythromycin esterase
MSLAGIAALSLVATADAAEEHALSWAREHSQQLDPAALGPLIGSARIVSFGEAFHGGEEFLTVRNRIFQMLVEEMGFTAIAVETGYADSVIADDYVRGHGMLNAATVASVFSFSSPAALRANRDLLEWMRGYNARSDVKRQIRFYGLEPIASGARSSVPKAAQQSLAYVRNVDPARARHFTQRLDGLLQRVGSKGYVALTEEQRNRLTLGLVDLISLFERRHVDWVTRSSVLDYERGYRNALNARALDADLRIGGWWLGSDGDLDQRDASSALALEWLLNREGPEGRVFVFAHNMHVRRGAMIGSGSERSHAAMGQHLSHTFGKQMVVIGSVYGQLGGVPAKVPVDPDPIDALLGRLGMPLFVLDLRAALVASGAGASWWNQERRFNSRPGFYFKDDFDRSLNPAASFDALVYIETVFPAVELHER